MRPFNYVQANSPAQATQAAAHADLAQKGNARASSLQAGGGQQGTATPAPRATPATTAPTDAPTQYIAGGTTMLDLMKLDVMRPQTLVDISPMRRGAVAPSASTAGNSGGGNPNPNAGASALASIDAGPAGLRFGALASMAEAADHAVVQRDYPVIAATLKLAASAQLRNMASLGGNVLQRTRCVYFRDVRTTACNKRLPGSGCAALDGVNRQHAVLGTSEACIASYPGDFAQALMVLDASVETVSAAGARRIPIAALHRRPGATPNIETALAPGELVTAITVPASAWSRRSHYVKIRDRDSYQFALTSAAVALDLAGGTVRSARVALGGVATVPWRSPEAEAALTGKPLDEASAQAAAEAAFAGAAPRRHNAFKVDLGKRTLVRALLEAGRMTA